MFFDTDLAVLAGAIFAVTAVFWISSFAPLVWAASTARVDESRSLELPFMVAQRGAMLRKSVLRRMVPVEPAVIVRELAPVGEPVVAAKVEPDSQRMTVDTQVARISEIVTRAVDGARDAGRLHEAAHEQLDAAHYALQNLLHELSAVMSVPGATVGQAASVKPVVPVAAVAPFETALAA